jgi:hypothetical protein
MWLHNDDSCGFETDSFDAETRRWQFRFVDAEGYDDVAPSIRGWIQYAMREVGVNDRPLANPGPKEVAFEAPDHPHRGGPLLGPR